MTELMKRYEAEFEKGLIHACYESWLETEISDNERYIATLKSKIVMYEYEIKQLKAQLTWRPVSEKPEKDGQCFVSLADGGMVIIGMWKSGELCIEEKYRWLGVKSWLPIPPAPEGE